VVEKFPSAQSSAATADAKICLMGKSVGGSTAKKVALLFVLLESGSGKC